MGVPSLPPLGPPNLANGDSGLGGQNDYAKWAEMRPYLRRMIVADYNAHFYGAKGDGVVNDTLAVLAAIADAGVTKGTVYLPAGVYNVDSTVVVGNGSSGVPSTINGVTVRGDGMYATTIRWIGAVGGTVASILGTCFGNAFTDLTIDGNATAAIGLHITSAGYASSPSLRITNTTSACLFTDAWASLASNQDTIGLHFGKVILECGLGTVGAQSHGLWLSGGPVNTWDTTQCSFGNLTIYAQKDYNTAIRLAFCDSNQFGVVNCFFFGGQLNRIGLHLDGAIMPNFPQNNLFALGNFGGAFLTTGTPGNNYITLYDTNDGAGAAPGPGSGLVGLAEPQGGQIPPYPFGSGAVVTTPGEVINTQLTTVAATTIVSLNLPTAGLYQANLMLRVASGAPNVTAIARCTDDSGGVVSYFFLGLFGNTGTTYFALNGGASGAASYTCIPVVLRYAGSGTVPQIVVTASVANVVFCSASILKIG